MTLRNWLLAVAAGVMFAGAAASTGSAQTIVVARGADGNSFDPPESQSFEAIKMADWAFDGLVRYDQNSLRIAPALAESWSRSDDGMVWTFNLRRGVTFHDGTDFNADAVVFSLERQRDTGHPYHHEGFGRWKAKFGNVAETKKVDEYTVEIHLAAPAPTLLVDLAFYIGYIVSPTAVMADPEGFRSNPVGTGPFRFVRYERDNFTQYERFDDYWAGPAKAERLIVRTIPDNDVRLLALINGEVHLAYGIGFSQFATVEANDELELLTAPSLGISVMSMNMDKAPFDNLMVRRAVNHAVNKQRIHDTVFAGYGQMADQVLPPEWFGHAEDGMTYEYDPEKARALLAEAGFADGFETTLITWNTPRPYLPAPRDAAALVKSDLAEVGIEVEIQTLSWGVYRTERGRGGFGMALGGWISSTLDPHGIAYPLYHSSFIRERDSINWARWSNKQADELLIKGGSMYDEAERDAIYQDAMRLLMEDSPSVFLAHPINSIVARTDLEGAFIHPSNWVPLHHVSVAQ